jgi:lysozyme family protein
MRDNFEKCLDVVLREEGGYVNDPRDPGGETNLGITKATLSDWLGRPATSAEVKGLTRETAAAIYRKNYWNPVSGDTLRPGVDLSTFDASVNSGPGRAREWLLRAVGGTDLDTVEEMSSIRTSFLRSLATFKAFGKGWAARVARIEARSAGMTFPAGTSTEVIKAELTKRAQEAERSKENAGKAGAAAGSGAVVVGGGAATTVDPSMLIVLAVIGIILVVAFIVTLHRRKVNKLREEAYLKEAGAVPIQDEV